MRLAEPQDRFYRLQAQVTLSGKDEAVLKQFNADVARQSGVPLEQLPVMPISAGVYPYTLSPVHHGFTLGCADLLVMIKGVAREMGILNNYIPKNYRTSQVARCQS
jgi:hypothetical protein